ncbi:hypothetical protein pb186bvf_015379 [Paramecium bursaria]
MNTFFSQKKFKQIFARFFQSTPNNAPKRFNCPKIQKRITRNNRYLEDHLETRNQITPRSEYSVCSQTAVTQIKKKPIRKQEYLHLKGKKKQYKFPLFDEQDLKFPDKFSGMLKKHKTDNDRETDDEQIQRAINYIQTDIKVCMTKENQQKKKKQ